MSCLVAWQFDSWSCSSKWHKVCATCSSFQSCKTADCKLSVLFRWWIQTVFKLIFVCAKSSSWKANNVFFIFSPKSDSFLWCVACESPHPFLETSLHTPLLLGWLEGWACQSGIEILIIFAQLMVWVAVTNLQAALLRTAFVAFSFWFLMEANVVATCMHVGLDSKHSHQNDVWIQTRGYCSCHECLVPTMTPLKANWLSIDSTHWRTLPCALWCTMVI